jgi:hypothetical protein
MSRLCLPRRRALVLFLLGAVGAGICAGVDQRAIDAVVAIPLVVYVTGAALVNAVDPWARRVAGAVRVYWSVLASFGLAVAGGFVLNVAGGLDRDHWCLVVAAIVGVTGAVGWVRGATAPGGTRRVEPVAATITPRSVLLVAVAVALVVGALTLSQISTSRAESEHFVELSILPQPVFNNDSTGVELMVTNDEGTRTAFVVTIDGTTPTPRTWTVVLAANARATLALTRPAGAAVTASVARRGEPGHLLASVDLAAYSS